MEFIVLRMVAILEENFIWVELMDNLSSAIKMDQQYKAGSRKESNMDQV